MTEANKNQVGGDHYQSSAQHWDFVCDYGLSYLEGCFTKYIIRHKKKNGLEDLKKAHHYLEKILEKNNPLNPTKTGFRNKNYLRVEKANELIGLFCKSNGCGEFTTQLFLDYFTQCEDCICSEEAIRNAMADVRTLAFRDYNVIIGEV